MYGKSFESMFEGSMVGAGINVFAVWGYIITKAKRGFIEINPKLLAFTLGGTEEEVCEALDFLQQPDPNSRSKLEDGRRLVKDGQFQYRIVNWEHYDQIRNEIERRDYNRVRKQQYRKLGAKPVTAVSSPADPPKPVKEFIPGLRTERILEKWAVWQTVRRAMKKPKNWDLLFDEQMEWLGQFSEPVAFEILSASIRNGWQGLFPPKEGGGPNGTILNPGNLRTIIEAKKTRAAELRTRFCSDTAIDSVWSDTSKRQEFFKLKKEIKALTDQLSNLA